MVLSTVVPTTFAAVDSLDKTRFRFIAGHLQLLLREADTGGKSDVLPFHLIDYSALNWDRGLVDCGTNILRGC